MVGHPPTNLGEEKRKNTCVAGGVVCVDSHTTGESNQVARFAGWRHDPRADSLPDVRSARWRVRQHDLYLEATWMKGNKLGFVVGSLEEESKPKIADALSQSHFQKQKGLSVMGELAKPKKAQHMVSLTFDLEDYRKITACMGGGWDEETTFAGREKEVGTQKKVSANTAEIPPDK